MAKSRFLAMLLLVVMAVSIFSCYSRPAYAGIDKITIGNSDTEKAAGYVKVEPAAQKGWNEILQTYKGVITGIAGVAALTFLVFFILNFAKLGSSAGNPQMRQQALVGIVWCGLACTALGGIAVFFGFFYGMLNK